MLSSGGVSSLADAARHPSRALVSGPAAGVVGAAGSPPWRGGVEMTISFDMGGTSTDVCLISTGGSSSGRRSASFGGFPHPPADRRSPDRWEPEAGRSSGATAAALSASVHRAPEPTQGRRATGAAASSLRSPTPTSCSVASPAHWPRGSSSTEQRPSFALGDFAAQAVIDVVNAEMLRALRPRLRRAGTRSAGLRARRIRRRRTAPTPAISPISWGSERSSSLRPRAFSPRSVSSPETSAATVCART